MKRWFASLVGLVMVSAATPAGAQTVREIDPDEAHRQVGVGELVLVDVRRPDEWAQTGLAKGAIGATLQDPDFVAQVTRALGGDTSIPVALICRTGARSTTAAMALQSAGFTQVYNVTEGMSGRSRSEPGWLARGLPVSSPQ